MLIIRSVYKYFVSIYTHIYHLLLYNLLQYDLNNILPLNSPYIIVYIDYKRNKCKDFLFAITRDLSPDQGNYI